MDGVERVGAWSGGLAEGGCMSGLADICLAADGGCQASKSWPNKAVNNTVVGQLGRGAWARFVAASSLGRYM